LLEALECEKLSSFDSFYRRNNMEPHTWTPDVLRSMMMYMLEMPNSTRVSWMKY